MHFILNFWSKTTLFIFVQPKILLNEKDVCFLTDLFFPRVNRNKTATKYHTLFMVIKKVLAYLDSTF